MSIPIIPYLVLVIEKDHPDKVGHGKDKNGNSLPDAKLECVHFCDEIKEEPEERH